MLFKRLFTTFLSLVLTSSMASAQTLNETRRAEREKMDELFSPLGKYRKDLHHVLEQDRKLVRSQIIIVDTREQEKCHLIQNRIERLGVRVDNFCEVDLAEPYRSVTLHRPATEQEFLENQGPQTVENKLTAQFALTGLAAMTFLYSLPVETTNWVDQKTDFNSISDRYFDHISQGPRMDQDSWKFNYVAHPIVGGWYYTSARHEGLSVKQSFKFAVLMSTFFWEFGYEAVAERPSYQDLLITPVVGSLFGEMFFHLFNYISANDQKFLGSQTLGRMVLFLLNPVEMIVRAVNRVMGHQTIKKSEFRYGLVPVGDGQYSLGVSVKFLF